MKKIIKEVIKKEEGKNLPHKAFWASMGILFLVSFLVMLSSLENIVTGHVTVQNIATAKAGSTLTLEVKTIPGVNEATIFFKEELKKSQISFAEDKNIPFSGLAYVKFTVSSPDQEKIGQMDLTFKVHELELRKVKINFKDLRLFVNDKEKYTTLVKKEKEYYYYSASTQELGAMVLGQTRQEQATLPTTIVPSGLSEEAVSPPSMEEAPILAQPELEVPPEAVSGKAAEQEEIMGKEKQNTWQRLKKFLRNLLKDANN